MPFGDEETTRRRKKWLIKALPYALYFAYIAYFWKEINDILSIPRWYFTLLFGGVPKPLPQTLGHSFLVLSLTIIVGFILLNRLWLYLFAWQAWLPVSNFQEIQQTASHFQLFMQGNHGPAVFIKNGKLQASLKELRTSRPGVIVADDNSAVVLESGVPGPNMFAPLVNMVKDIFMVPRQERKRIRVRGPGITFTYGTERIYGVADLKNQQSIDEISGVVDLRSQIRLNEKWLGKDPPPNGPRVSCYTRDGIELKTNVWALFTIGQEPDVVQVTYRGKRRLENLCVVNLEDLPGGNVRIKGFGEREQLDEQDYLEIHREVSALHPPAGYQFYQPVKRPGPAPVFNEQRVFEAVYSTARTLDQLLIPWIYLPSHVAIDMFREIISQVNYDELYAVGDGSNLLGDVQNKLRLRMRANGLLSYRLIVHGNHTELEAGKEYPSADLRVYTLENEPQKGKPFETSKVLRDRGIKIIAAGFSDLVPVSDIIYQQRLNNWRATWETDTAISKYGYELEAMRIRNRARVQAQQELSYSFSQLFNRNQYSDEILAIHIFQSLENIASDPGTHKLLPGETINLLRTVHDWLLPPSTKPPFG